jgi:uncharacterized phage protein (TIGR02220 family)
MHWIRRDIGAYHKKAGRLSMIQHGAYTLLLDACYDRERFPTMDEAIEWVWPSNKEETDALKFVLDRFFTLMPDGTYEQDRVREEVAKYQSNSATNKRIAREREAKRRELLEIEGTKRDEAPPNKNKNKNKNNPPIVPQGDRDIAKMALELMAQISNRKFKPIESNITPITARLADGHTAQEIGEVLRHQWLKWKGTDSEMYFRPSTLFRPSKFEGYLNDANNPVVTKLTRSTRDISLQESLTDTSWAN